MDCRGRCGATWGGTDRLYRSEHSKGSDQVLRSERAHSFGSGTSRRGDNRSLDRPRGGDLPHHSTPAIRSAALEAYEASFKSLVIRGATIASGNVPTTQIRFRIDESGITRSSNMVNEKGNVMAILLLALLVLILFGAGFAVHLLWIAAVVFGVVWVAAFALGRGERRSIRR